MQSKWPFYKLIQQTISKIPISTTKPAIVITGVVFFSAKATMTLLRPCYHHYQSLFTPKFSSLPVTPNSISRIELINSRRRKAIRGCTNGEKRSFLTLEEAGLVEMSGLSSHERFLCRLTISSLNLLRVVAEQEGCPIEELNAGRLCDWFLKDKLKKEQNLGTPVLEWEESDFQL